MPSKILIVEDERIVAKHLEVRLTRLGYEVSGNVASAEAALQKVETERPDLVLMDIRLEGKMDGIEAGTQIHERHKVPVIYVTAYTDDGTFERAKKTKPCGYLIKPYNDGELKRVVELALHKHTHSDS